MSSFYQRNFCVMTTTWLNQSLQPRSFAKSCPRKDKRGVDLISDALPFGRLWYGEPNAVSNAIDYAKFYSRPQRCDSRLP
jgi:hypothetical protein